MRLLRLILIAMLCLTLPAYGYVPPMAQDDCASQAAGRAAGTAPDGDACCPDMGMSGAGGADACTAACSVGGTCRTVGVLAPAIGAGPSAADAPPPDPGATARIPATDPAAFWRPPRS